MRVKRVTFAGLLLLALIAPSSASAQSEVSGPVTHVRDGDTIEVAGVPIRFGGVSAPELDEPYGEQSKNAMRGLVAGQRVRCELTVETTYDRHVGTCFLEDGRNLSAEIFSMGLARDCPRYSGGRYEQYETERSRRLPFPGYCEVQGLSQKPSVTAGRLDRHFGDSLAEPSAGISKGSQEALSSRRSGTVSEDGAARLSAR